MCLWLLPHTLSHTVLCISALVMYQWTSSLDGIYYEGGGVLSERDRDRLTRHLSSAPGVLRMACQVWLQSGSDWQQIEQIRDSFRSWWTRIGWNLIWWSPWLVSLEANLTHIRANPDIPDWVVSLPWQWVNKWLIGQLPSTSNYSFKPTVLQH